ncbi:hypothetical protein [Pseudoalteromonas simplex]|uniref:hypothetical protein n=1 Tax=Pseudoalteromonas simplex TaxID=2783613 RepID=UPI001888517E|nr:hypothetical protein [Pseudoalteromonas sp. A520]
MIAWLKRWLAERAMPVDPNFKHRIVAKQKLGHFFIVELGASDYVIIHDMLGRIQAEDTDDATKSRELMGLRYMALAMSLRTGNGRMPFDWQNDVDLMYLATLPHSKVIPALDEIAAISGIDWITPSFIPKETDTQLEEVEQPTQEDLDANPS